MTIDVRRVARGFSFRCSRFRPSRSWGIGEIGDLERDVAAGSTRAGQRVLQLLPINEMPPGESSPYSALSAMAIDPQFITVD